MRCFTDLPCRPSLFTFIVSGWPQELREIIIVSEHNRRDMRKSFFFLIVACIVTVLVTGCTSTSSNPATITTVTTPALVTTAVTIVPTSQVTPVPTLSTTAVTTVVTTAPPTDPILHRWIWQYGDPTAAQSTGYEFKFYPDGSVDYREGTTKQMSSNIVIDTTYPYSEETGTWTPVGNMTYLIKILPTGQTGAQIIRQYTLVPAHQDPRFPGITVPAQIVSSYETDLIGANMNEQPNADLMYYPEQAEID